ncbi:MAG: hypothetical protein A2189_01545 [Paenibacillus sp. RIFOXYA1_FULL_44_5]|nr:MAG: hypothetical protein A2189_01545 [Paenibacillus sp. RIFOXYA1_FULL_44_5]
MTNFRFRNNTGHYVLIRTEVHQTAITVKIFGTLPAKTDYVIDAKVVKRIASPIKYVEKPGLPSGAAKVIKQGKAGYIVETYRITKTDGHIVRRELISRDTYLPSETIIAVPDQSQFQDIPLLPQDENQDLESITGQ